LAEGTDESPEDLVAKEQAARLHNLAEKVEEFVAGIERVITDLEEKKIVDTAQGAARFWAKLFTPQDGPKVSDLDCLIIKDASTQPVHAEGGVCLETPDRNEKWLPGKPVPSHPGVFQVQPVTPDATGPVDRRLAWRQGLKDWAERTRPERESRHDKIALAWLEEQEREKVDHSTWDHE
jgi:hypothetical protein